MTKCMTVIGKKWLLSNLGQDERMIEMRNIVLIVEVNDDCGLTDAGLFEYLSGELKASDASGEGHVKKIYSLTEYAYGTDDAT